MRHDPSPTTVYGNSDSTRDPISECMLPQIKHDALSEIIRRA